MRYKDLCNLILAREFHHGLGDVAAAEDSRFDLQAPSEAKVLLHRLSFLGW